MNQLLSMNRFLFSLTTVLGSGLAAAESASASTPIVVVGGEPIVIRELEMSLLAREGNDALNAWLRESLDRIDWTRMPEDTPVVIIGNRVLTRRALADDLLAKHGAEVREELIGIRLVEQALRREQVTIDAVAMETEWARIDRAFQAKLAEKNQPSVPFEQYIQASKGQSKAQLMAEPGFRMAAGLHLLVDRRATREIADSELNNWFLVHRSRFDQTAAVDLSVITIPYKHLPAPEEERQRLLGVVRSLHASISRGKPTFAQAWNAYGRAYDPRSVDGRAGWIRKDGSRSDGGRAIPAVVMQAAWESKAPRLMEPVDHDSGVDLIFVHAHRPAQSATFAAVREQVLATVLDEQRDVRTQRILTDLRRATEIEYRSLPEAIALRSATAAKP